MRAADTHEIEELVTHSGAIQLHKSLSLSLSVSSFSLSIVVIVIDGRTDGRTEGGAAVTGLLRRPTTCAMYRALTARRFNGEGGRGRTGSRVYS